MTLQEYIEKYQLSQKDAAAKFDISEAALSRILRGERKPSKLMKEHLQRKTAQAVSVESWA